MTMPERKRQEPARFEVVDEGFVVRGPLAACSRVVQVGPDELVCTYVTRSGAGIADYTVELARSRDLGHSWTQHGPVWPDLVGRASMSMALSRGHSDPNELFLYGTTTPVGRPGESWWDGERQALKQNDLVWAQSVDGGRRWTRPTVIPMSIPGSAEAPGPLTVTSRRRWIACYAPYNTFDPSVVVDRNQIVAVYSDDRGRTWRHTSMLRFADPNAGGAEAWVVELEDGRLVGTCWSMSLATGVDTPIPFAISHDGGTTWAPTRSTGIAGQATSLAPAAHAVHARGDDVELSSRVLLAYNQRAEPDPGVWLAVARPTDDDFGAEAIGPAWLAEQATHTSEGDAGHDAWTDFAFGEPSVTLLWDGDVLVTLWCDQPSGRGIRFVRLAGASVHGWAVSAGVTL
jgi:BNR repeat protein